MEDSRVFLEEVAASIQKRAISSSARKRKLDRLVRLLFLVLTLISASVVVVVLLFVLVKGLKPFFGTYTETLSSGVVEEGKESFSYFLTGSIFKGGFDTETKKFLFGGLYLAANTLILLFFVLLFSIPLSLLTSLFMTRIAPKPLAKVAETSVDLLASIPSVIYGVFGMGVILPIVKSMARGLGMKDSSGVSLLAGALLLSLMVMPTIISVSVTALKAVDENQIKGSLALGATKTETNFKIALRSARSGILAGISLGVGRALGEATAVSMVMGLIPGVTRNPFLPASVLTSQMLADFGEAVPGSMNYDIRFSLGIVLMGLILLFNLILNDVKRNLETLGEKKLFIARVVIFFKTLFHRTKSALAKRKGAKA